MTDDTFGLSRAWFNVPAFVKNREFHMSIRAAVMSAGLLLAISFWGLAVYTDGAMAGKGPGDGYGISAASVVPLP